jgi:hypothetical protein
MVMVDYKFKAFMEIHEIAGLKHFAVTMVGGADTDQKYADIIIHLNEDDMLALKVNPTTSEYPLELFPYDKPIRYDELNTMLETYVKEQNMLKHIFD